jgi:uncharacterized membrane protein
MRLNFQLVNCIHYYIPFFIDQYQVFGAVLLISVRRIMFITSGSKDLSFLIGYTAGMSVAKSDTG